MPGLPPCETVQERKEREGKKKRRMGKKREIFHRKRKRGGGVSALNGLSHVYTSLFFPRACIAKKKRRRKKKKKKKKKKGRIESLERGGGEVVGSHLRPAASLYYIFSHAIAREPISKGKKKKKRGGRRKSVISSFA